MPRVKAKKSQKSETKTYSDEVKQARGAISAVLANDEATLGDLATALKKFSTLSIEEADLRIIGMKSDSEAREHVLDAIKKSQDEDFGGWATPEDIKDELKSRYSNKNTLSTILSQTITELVNQGKLEKKVVNGKTSVYKLIKA